MSELLKFACPAPKCGRKFFTAEKLETHIKIRHPLLSFSSSSTNESNQINENSKINTNNISDSSIQTTTKQQIKNTNIKPENKIEQKLEKNNNITTLNNNNIQNINNDNFNSKINPKNEFKKTENITPHGINKKEEQPKEINKINKIQKINKLNNKPNINNKTIKDKNNSKINKKVKNEIKQSKEEKELDKKIEEIEDKINKSEIDDMNSSKIKDDKEQKDKKEKEKLEKEKRKLILDNLYSKINSLENYFENETLELQKQFELSEIPVFEDINMENEKIEEVENEKENEKEKQKIEENNVKDENDEISIVKEEEKEKEIKEKNEKDNEKGNEKSNNEVNNYDISESQKNYDIGKIIEITDDMIFKNTKFEDYDEFIELDLSKQNIASFMNNRNVPFEEFTELQKLNLSYNWMTYTYDIRFFIKLKELYINDNKIDDLSFAESLPNLEILNVENNQISYITSLTKCINLKILKLALNKIEFLNSSLNTIKNLRKLEELTIKDNPFLTQLFAYKQYFIYNYQNILKLDEEDINDIDRDIAGRFVRENNLIYKNTTKRPMSSRPRPNQKIEKFSKNLNLDDDNLKKIEENEEEENEDNNNIFSQTQTTFRVGNAIISKEMFVPYKGREKNYNNRIQKIKKDEKEINSEEKESKELKELKEIIKEQKEEIDNLNLELENINQLNKEYEIMIQDYKIKLEQKKINQKNNPQNKIINSNEIDKVKDNEKNKLLKELEMWKKEYCDLFNRTTKNSSILSQNDKKTKLLSDNLLQKPYNNNFNKKDDTKNNLYKSMPNNEIKQIINRPQTAKVKSNKSIDFDNFCEGIKIMHSRNNFADVLEEKTDDDEEEEKEEKEKNEINNDNNKINIEDKNEDKDLVKENEPNFEEDDDILDEEIDEMFRKSCADLEKMREEIKFMNENIDKNKTYVNNNMGGKVKLNPVIVKKEYKSNLTGNRGIFGNINNNKI